MNENWNNSRLMLNGRVKPPIVLRSDTEIFIAQNAHNLIWEKYRSEYDALHKEITEGSQNWSDERWQVMHTTAKQEIDELIILEIATYRQNRMNINFDIEERFEQIEKSIEEIRDLAEEAQSTAEEALEK